MRAAHGWRSTISSRSVTAGSRTSAAAHVRRMRFARMRPLRRCGGTALARRSGPSRPRRTPGALRRPSRRPSPPGLARPLAVAFSEGSGPKLDLAEIARRGRLLVLESVAHSGAGHIGGPLSAMDLLVALYFAVLRIRPEDPDWPDRDRFILSKGHSPAGLYGGRGPRG